MPKCAVKKGFFMLRDCGQTTARVCARCARFVCEAHSIDRDTTFLCQECLAKANDHEGDWVHDYRHRYYVRTRYSPYYSGHYYDHYYDDYDVRAFDRELSEPVDTGDDDSGGFMDS